MLRTNLPLIVSASVISLAIGAGAGVLGTMWCGYRILPDNDWGNRAFEVTMQVKGTMPAPNRNRTEPKKAKKPRAILASLEDNSAELLERFEAFLRQSDAQPQIQALRNAIAVRAELTAS